jgi:AcrR family transcriptional regulator
MSLKNKTREPSPQGRARILKSALAVFAEFGFAGASTREIARRADVTQPSIGYFFRSKEELWKATIENVFAELNTTLDAAVSTQGSLTEQRRRIVVAFVRFAATNPEWSMYNVHEGLQTGERSRWLAQNWIQPLALRLFEGLTGETWPQGNGPPVLEALSLVSLLAGATLIFAQKNQAAVIVPVDVGSEEFIDHHTNIIFLLLETLIQRSGFSAPGPNAKIDPKSRKKSAIRAVLPAAARVASK